MTQTFQNFAFLGGNMHKIHKYRGYFMCTKWFLRRLGPHSLLPHLRRLVCMEMNKNVPNIPTCRGSHLSRPHLRRSSLTALDTESREIPC